MARPLRIEFPGAVYHITSRGNERKAIFLDDQDHKNFLETIHRVTVRYNWLCHAYCLMDNHYHLIIETPDGNLSIGMRQLNGVYTQLFNNRYERAGHLFQGRFKVVVVQKDSHLMEACRYIVLNPVRAKIMESPRLWKWSSYLPTAGGAKPHACLTTDWILGQFGSARKSAESEYRKFIKAGIHTCSLWDDVRAQSILGEDDFMDSLADYVKGRRDIAEIPKSQSFMDRPTLASLFSKEISQNISARDMQICEAVERHGYKQREIADYVGLHFASISRILRTKGAMLIK